jgi:hypothetical protein
MTNNLDFLRRTTGWKILIVLFAVVMLIKLSKFIYAFGYSFGQTLN